jgi:hypothetical protein
MRYPLLVPLLLALATYVPLMAEEMRIADLRLGGGVLSNHFTGANQTTVTSGGSVVSSSTSSEDGRDSDHNYRGQLQFIGGHLGAGGGFVFGLGIAANHARWDNGSQDATATTPCADLLLGYGFAPAKGWHFELMPFAGIGRAYYSVTDSGETHTSKDWDTYVEYGARLGTYFTINDGFQIGVEVPYLVGSFKPDYEYTDSGNNVRTVSDKRESRGFGLLVTIGGRF